MKLTGSGALQAVRMLQSAYPNDSYKLKDDTSKGFMLLLMDKLRDIEDEDALKVIKDLAQSQKYLPSVSDIAKAVADDRRKRTLLKREIEQQRALEPPAHREEIKTEGGRAIVSKRIREFSRRYFPDIDDDLIERNLCTLSGLCDLEAEQWKAFGDSSISRTMPTVPRIDKKTGDIYPVVVVTEQAWQEYLKKVKR